MNLELFIAQRLNKRDLQSRSLSYLIIQITTVAIALSVATMIISIAIVVGFRYEIVRKLSDFVGDILITKHTSNESYELEPIAYDSTVVDKIMHVKGVRHVQVFAIKPGLIKHGQEIEGVVLKGIWRDFNKQDFEQYLTEGQFFDLPATQKSKQVLISQELARQMNYKLGDKVFMLFIQQPPKLRVFKISGIYSTGLVDFDQIYILSDIRQIQKLNNWTDSSGFLISGYEVFVDDFKQLDQVALQLKRTVAFGFDPNKPKLKVTTIKELYPDIFEWLTLVDMNVVVILVIMLIIALINMTTGMLIIILEKTSFIGILKALGASNGLIKRIFIYNSWFMLKRGLFWGNLLALGFILLQKYFHLIPLNPEIYFVRYVPVKLNFLTWIGINLGTIIITLIFMLLPATVAAKVQPIKAIKFE